MLRLFFLLYRLHVVLFTVSTRLIRWVLYSFTYTAADAFMNYSSETDIVDAQNSAPGVRCAPAAAAAAAASAVVDDLKRQNNLEKKEKKKEEKKKKKNSRALIKGTTSINSSFFNGCIYIQESISRLATKT